jgi:hypothetical protein
VRGAALSTTKILTAASDEQIEIVRKLTQPPASDAIPEATFEGWGIVDIAGVIQVSCGFEVYAVGPPPAFTYLVDRDGPKVQIEAGVYGSLLMTRELAAQLRDGLEAVLSHPEAPVTEATVRQIEAMGYTMVEA